MTSAAGIPPLYQMDQLSEADEGNTFLSSADENLSLDLLSVEAARSAKLLMYCREKLLSLIDVNHIDEEPTAGVGTALEVASFIPSCYVYGHTLVDHYLWNPLMEQVLHFPVESTRYIWRLYFSVFPTSLEKLVQYCKAEINADNERELLYLFENNKNYVPRGYFQDADRLSMKKHFAELASVITLTECASVPLWMIYLDAAEAHAQRSMEGEDVVWSRVHTSYIYTKSVVGSASDALDFWKRYINFLETRIYPSIEQKSILRNVYQEALMSPIVGVGDLMELYMSFEKSLLPKGHGHAQRNVTLGGDLKAAHQKATITAEEIRIRFDGVENGEWYAPTPVSYLRKRCDVPYGAKSLPRDLSSSSVDLDIEKALYQRFFQSNFDESATDIAHYMRWKKRIFFELSNPLELRCSSDAWVGRMTYMYTKALVKVRFHTDMWIEFAKFLTFHKQYDRAIHVYERALRVFPGHRIVRCVYADTLASSLGSCPKQAFGTAQDGFFYPVDLPCAKQRAVQIFENFIEAFVGIRFPAQAPLRNSAEGNSSEQEAEVVEIDQNIQRLVSMYVAYIQWSLHAMHHHAQSHISKIVGDLHQMAKNVAYLQEVFFLVVKHIKSVTKDEKNVEAANNLQATGWSAGVSRGFAAAKWNCVSSIARMAFTPATDEFLHFSGNRKGDIDSYSKWCAAFELFMQKENLRPKCTHVIETALPQRLLPTHNRQACEGTTRFADTVMRMALLKDPLIATEFINILQATDGNSALELLDDATIRLLRDNVIVSVHPSALVLHKQGNQRSIIQKSQKSPSEVPDDIAVVDSSVCRADTTVQAPVKENPLIVLLDALPAKVGCLRVVDDLSSKVPSAQYVMNVLRSNPL